jgi:hypothetical protein
VFYRVVSAAQRVRACVRVKRLHLSDHHWNQALVPVVTAKPREFAGKKVRDGSNDTGAFRPRRRGMTTEAMTMEAPDQVVS